MANPIEVSAAATERMKRVNNCPTRSSRYTDPIRKRKFTANNESSIDIITIKIFFRFRKRPQRPKKNIKRGTRKITIGSISEKLPKRNIHSFFNN